MDDRNKPLTDLRREPASPRRPRANAAPEAAGKADARQAWDSRDPAADARERLLAGAQAAQLEADAERARLQLALDAGRMGTWEWNVQTQHVTWSPALEAIHGLAPGEFAGTFEAYQRDIHPDDRARVLATIQRTLAERRDHRLSYRIVLPDGEIRWLDARGMVVTDAAGAPVRVVGVCMDATDRVRAETAVRESERRFRAVFDGALDAILIVGDDQRIVEANDAAAELLGYTREALYALRVIDLVPPAARQHTEALWQAFRAEGRQRGETVFVRLDGRPRHVEYSATANFVPGRHLSVLRDVTERRVAEAADRFLAQASATLASSLDYQATLAAVARMSVPTIADWATVDVLGPDHTLQRLAVAHVDPAKVELAHELWRRWPPTMDDAAGAANVIRTGCSEIVYELTDAVLEAAVSDPELRAILRTLGLASSMCVPLTVRGKTIGAITLLVSDSGRHFTAADLALAEELGRRASVAMENATSYREAMEASRLKDEFLATVSHELRTPLTAVLGWATMVRNRQHDATYVAKGLATIERNARAQAQLIEDLLDLSRIITGKLRLEVQPLALSGLVETALDTIRPAAAAKGITVQTVLDPTVETIVGDADRLLQVVNNLVTNATKFTPRGGTIRVAVRRVDGAVELVVEDNGQGIRPDFLPHVFERFRQADASMTRTQGGLGLGLAICRSLVELHGGAITASSAGEGQGAAFTVHLPIARAHAIAPAERPRLRPAEAGLDLEQSAALSGLRVLVVDDEPDTRDLLAAILEHCAARTTVAASAAEALAALRRDPPDVLVSDIGMPHEDGLALIRKVRALPAVEGGRVPAIALTAYASTGDRTRALLAGFDQFVAKPIENQELVVVIANLAARFARG